MKTQQTIKKKVIEPVGRITFVHACEALWKRRN